MMCFLNMSKGKSVIFFKWADSKVKGQKAGCRSLLLFASCCLPVLSLTTLSVFVVSHDNIHVVVLGCLK